MTEEQLIYKIIQQSKRVEFDEVIAAIDDHYQYQKTEFSNGNEKNMILNQAGENEGSCKIFAFAMLHGLTEIQTLHCFGKYYRKDVLENPASDSHANIRQFMKTGWKGIRYQGNALLKI